MDNKEIFGKRFKEIRKKFGYTQDKMAEIAGIEPQSISKIESGKNYPLLSNLEKIAKRLEIDLKDFFCYEHKDVNLREVLLNIFDKLDQNDKERLLRIAYVLKV